MFKPVGYDPLMAHTLYLHQWCQYLHLTLSQLSDQTGIELETVRSVQEGSRDPSLSLLNAIAEQLHIPTSWLLHDPQVMQRLWNDPDEEEPELPDDHSIDPMFARMIQAYRQYPELFLLLTNLVHYDDPKLIRASHVNLQSLVKQIRKTTLPWGSRPPGHFEPPSD
ncbi:MAG: helix-turn-helix transcriptional regulator [Verrucomicrobia bacterium]|nr:helix-turn-helix transcriptional regulator [Verrucomicrobiota bacterium]